MKRRKIQIKKRGQIQTLESVAVLFVFFILLALSMVFYMSYAKSKESGRLAEINREQAMLIAQQVINLPELKSSRRAVRGVNTIDAIKLEALKNVLDRNFDLRQGIYQERFGSSIISVREIYPGQNEWQLYSNPDLDANFRNEFYVPVSLYNPLEVPGGNYSVGLLHILYYGG
ncbi:hypothetical protein KY325_01385 [Candidatus Woesearchaeota archaeon]|nr:hypothetical protein [Candidatus Woesearchaeota archaeon]MBW3017791.1 hypothetical protein [Candidatus Woesearchaeota archaeon]